LVTPSSDSQFTVPGALPLGGCFGVAAARV
jgi:hypothetical protein